MQINIMLDYQSYTMYDGMTCVWGQPTDKNKILAV